MENKEYKLTQKQFDWLIDIVNSPYHEYSDKIRTASSKLLKQYGFKGWYDVNGQMAFQLLTNMVRESKKQLQGDDLPF
mgnify:CR=1 FL=1